MIKNNYPFNNLYQIIENNNKNSANKIIIFDADIKITNAQFKIYVDNLAQYLHNNNIKHGDRVAIVMSNSWKFIINLFAISKLGAIAVPINNFLKAEELRYILNDSGAKILFASNKFASEVVGLLHDTALEKIIWCEGAPFTDAKNISYDDLELEKNNGLDKIHGVFPSNLNDILFILYTSGTTGKPKGAILSYKNILSNCDSAKVLMQQKDGKFKMLAYLPMFHAFTLTVTVILPIYTNSAVIVIRSIGTKKDFKYLLKQLLLHRCRYFTGVPDVYSAMAKANLPWYFHWFHNVRGFISGAAALSDEVARKFASSFKKGKLLQGYGITECSPVVSCNSLDNNKFGSVGKPLHAYKVKIVDENLTEMPTKEIGEICVYGDCIMQGYYNKPQDTKEVIFDGGWFRTGDLGYLDEDGFIFIVDRKKDIIIHKGMNIYPREIEEVLYTLDKIKACAVIGVKDAEGIESPVAYIELNENQTLTEREVKEYLKSKLAIFKQPRRIIFIAELPRNATKKILKRELRDLHAKNYQ